MNWLKIVFQGWLLRQDPLVRDAIHFAIVGMVFFTILIIWLLLGLLSSYLQYGENWSG